MSDRGFFFIDRSVWEHQSFAKEQFTELQAWFWLISNAAWEPTKVRIGRACFDLSRGQCAFALRFLARKWMWSQPRVRRFLRRRTGDAQVFLSATREATLITICNYDKYQTPRRTDVPPIDPPLDSKATQRRKNQEIKKEEKKDSPSLGSDWPPDYGDLFWKAYPRKTEKKSAMAKLDSIQKSGKVPWAVFAAGVNRYRHHVAGTEEKYIKHPTTWLNRGCWDDEFELNNGGMNGQAANAKIGFAGIAARLRQRTAGPQFDAESVSTNSRHGDSAPGVERLETFGR